jgi:DNA-binding HxlR family transcriptional regulator
VERVFEDIDYVRPFLHDVRNIVGKRWNFHVLWEMRNQKKIRYNELLYSLHGISPSTLSEVLKQLQKESLIRRVAHGKVPPLRVEYSITQKGLDLIVASSALLKWTMKERKRISQIPLKTHN